MQHLIKQLWYLESLNQAQAAQDDYVETTLHVMTLRCA
jgi:hypothetical protein